MKNFFKNIHLLSKKNKIITIMVALCITVNFYTSNLQATQSNASQLFKDRHLMQQVKGFLVPENRNSYNYPKDYKTDNTLRAINRDMALLNITMKDDTLDGTVRTICFDNTNSVGFLTFLKKCLPAINKVLKQRNRPLFLNLSGINKNITDQVITELFTLKADASEEERQNLIELNTIFKNQVIGLTIGGDLTEDGYDNLLSHCYNLKRLEAYFYPNNNFIKIIGQNCPNLLSLKLQNCHKITNKGLRALRFCKELESISLHECMNINSVGLAGLAHSCRNLKNVSFSLSKIGNVGIRTLASCCPNLESLDMHHDQNITNIKPLKGCKNLTSLAIRPCNDALINQLIELPQLRSLNIYTSNINQAIQSIVQCQNLNHLNLSGNEITDAELSNLAVLQQLKSLNLSSCDQITDTAVIALTANCPQLQSIDLSYCRHITNAVSSQLSAIRPGIIINGK